MNHRPLIRNTRTTIAAVFTVVWLITLGLGQAAAQSGSQSTPAATQAAVQPIGGGLSVGFIIENNRQEAKPTGSVPAIDPGNLRFDAARYAAQLLTSDALFYHTGITHQISVMTYAGHELPPSQMPAIVIGPYTTQASYKDDTLKKFSNDLTSKTTLVYQRH